MSMLSAQIDHLRELADALDGRYGYQGYEIAMRDAADTICELRGALQVASVDYRHLADENKKLRELASGLHKCWASEGCEGCPMQDDDGWCVRDIRLRELGVEVPDGD